jgi:hypothetical protein
LFNTWWVSFWRKTVDVQLIQNQSDFLSFLRGEAMPNGNLSIRGVARCCGVHQSSTLKSESDGFVSKKLGQTLIGHGFEAAGLGKLKKTLIAKMCYY